MHFVYFFVIFLVADPEIMRGHFRLRKSDRCVQEERFFPICQKHKELDSRISDEAGL